MYFFKSITSHRAWGPLPESWDSLSRRLGRRPSYSLAYRKRWVFVNDLVKYMLGEAEMAELVDARALRALGRYLPCGFESLSRHHFAEASWCKAPCSRWSEVVVRSLGEVGQIMAFHYAYILKLSNGDYYIGQTDNLRRRIREHKQGQQRTTKNFLPCTLVTYIAFKNKKLSKDFEKYLKTGSGFAFKNKHLV